MTSPWYVLLANLGIVAIFVSVWTHSVDRVEGWPHTLRVLVLTMLTGGGAVALMLLPFPVQPGVFFDLRAVPIALSGFLGGPAVGLATGVIAAIYRATVGGIGAPAGVISIAVATLIGMGGHFLLRGRLPRQRDIIVLAVAAAAGNLSGLFALPGGLWRTVLPLVAAPATALIFLATVFAGLAILNEFRRWETSRSNLMYRAIIDALPDSLNAKDLAGRFLAANPATAKLMRAESPSALLGRTDFDFYPHRTAQIFRDDEDKVLAAGRPLTIEQQIAREDGSIAWLSTLKAPLHDRAGSIIGLLTHNRDITDRKRLEDEHAESQQRLSDALASMADALVMIDRDDKLVYCNEQYRALFPMTADIRIPGANVGDILRASVERGEQAGVAPEDAEAWLESTRASLRVAGDTDIHLNDGRWLHTRILPTADGASLSVISDVTTSRLAEKRLAELNEALAESESRWNFALASAGQGVWDHDLKNGRTFYSRTWRLMRGLDPDQHTDESHAAWLDRLHPDDREYVIEQARLQDAGELRGNEFEYRERHRDGHWVWILSRGKPIEWMPDGSVARIVGTDTDISKLKAAEGRLADALANMADALVMFDRDDKLVYCNEQYRAMFPQTADVRVPGASLRDILRVSFERGEPAGVSPENAEAWIEGTCVSLRVAGNMDIQLGDGRLLHARVRPTADGASLSVISDVTISRRAEKKLAELNEALAESESRWNFALESAGQGVWDHDLRNGRVFYSRMWKLMRGLDPDEKVDGSQAAWLARVHPDDRERILKQVDGQDSGELKFNEFEYRERHRDGHWVWILSRGKPVELMPDGSVARIVGTDTDISKLKAAEGRLADALANMADALVKFDRDETLVYCNEQYRAMFPKTAHLRVPGAKLGDILRASVEAGEPAGVSPENAEAWIDRTSALLRSAGDWEIEQADGRWLNVRASTVADGGYLSVISDVTRKKLAERTLSELNERLEALARLDGLTELRNRRAFDETLEAEFARVARNKAPLSLLLIDVDWFKAYNDTYGHLAGDECLRTISDTLRNTLNRPSDMAARYGGEELAAILPDTTADGAFQIAETFRAAVRGLDLPHTGSEKGFVTVSVGVATFGLGLAGVVRRSEDLIGRADQALYGAKAAGRDRVHSDRPRPVLLSA